VSAVNRACISVVDIRSLLNGLSLELNHKKVDNGYDHDIKELKNNIHEFANKALSKLELIDLINQRTIDVKKISISGIDGIDERIISVEKDKISQLSGQS